MKKVLALALAAVMLFALAACGGNGGEEETSKDLVKVIDIKLTNEEYAFGVDKKQPELLKAANELIAEIKADGTYDNICNKYFGDGAPTAVKSAALDPSKDQLVVATNAEFEPFEFKKGDSFYGIDMEIAELLAKKLNKELVINNMNFDAVCLSVNQSQSDIAMAGLTINDERKEILNFTDSYYEASQKLIVPANDKTFDACTDAASVEAILKGFDKSVTIGYQNGTTGQFYVNGDKDWGFDGFNVTGKGYGAGSLAVQDLINGNIKCVIIDEAPANAIVTATNAVA